MTFLLLNSSLQMLVFRETVAVSVYEILFFFFLFASVYIDLVMAHRHSTGHIFHTI